MVIPFSDFEVMNDVTIKSTKYQVLASQRSCSSLYRLTALYKSSDLHYYF